jgi:nitroimidazol reductase NimA-like FMN-containing flavoprotein (pyridoxamine 5'-phosphate oxidase superfamily)
MDRLSMRCGDAPARALPSRRRDGPWSEAEVDAHLERTLVPLRLGCASREGGPLVASLWYVYEDGALWCATRGSARVAQLLWEDPRCAFEVAADAPPYRGVRGQGRADLLPERGEAVLRRLIRRYLGSEDVPLARRLLRRPEAEVALRIVPRRLVSWDYGARMSGSVAPSTRSAS